MGALRTSMATCGYKDLAEFNRAELDDRPVAADRGQGAADRAGRGHGLARRGGAAHPDEPNGNGAPAADKAPASTG